MNAAAHTAYQTLRDYLNSLLLPTLPDQPQASIPVALRPSLAVFMQGKTQYENEDGQPMIYAADLAAWASDVIYGAGLPFTLPLLSLDVPELTAATYRPAA